MYIYTAYAAVLDGLAQLPWRFIKSSTKYPNRSIQEVLEELLRTRQVANPNNGFMTQLYAIETSTLSNPPLKLRY